MFSLFQYSDFQQYWWIIISLLASILVFLFFVQGGQSLIYSIASTELERSLILNATGRKWEFTFTTLVTFGGAFFASFPLFYSTSFGGAYWVWMSILFVFIIQAVSYEFRSKANNFLGKRTFDFFLFINGLLGSTLIGVAVSTFFTGAEFSINKANIFSISTFHSNTISSWETPFHGLEALWTIKNWTFIQNISLGIAIFFLSRVLATMYLRKVIDYTVFFPKLTKSLKINALFFLIFFLFWFIRLLMIDGFATNPINQKVFMEPHKYLHNFIEMPLIGVLLLLGIALVLIGILKNGFFNGVNGIWYSGIGTIITVWMLLSSLGFNNSVYYPSTFDLQSSLTIYNSSSSEFTLKVMSYVSLFIPFVLTYIIIVWRKIDSKKISSEEKNNTEIHIY